MATNENSISKKLDEFDDDLYEKAGIEKIKKDDIDSFESLSKEDQERYGQKTVKVKKILINME